MGIKVLYISTKCVDVHGCRNWRTLLTMVNMGNRQQNHLHKYWIPGVRYGIGIEFLLYSKFIKVYFEPLFS